MKKGSLLFAGLIISLLLISFVLAAETEVNQTTTKDFKTQTNTFLEKDITIPDNLQIFANVLFGLNNETLPIENMITLLGIWIILFLLIQAITEIIPFFGEGWKSWVAAAIITALISITGSIQNVSLLFFAKTRDLLGNLGQYSFFFILLNLIVLIILGWGAKMLLDMIKRKLKIEIKESKAYQEEFGQGAGI